MVDSREQLPLDFKVGGLISEVRVEKLDYGDYQALYLDGERSTVVFERKSRSDLWTTMASKEYNRFRREMERAKRDKAMFVIAVEGTIEQVSEGSEYSTFKGESMLKKLGTLMFKHGIPTMFNPTRADMIRMMTWAFESEGYHRARTKHESL